MEGFLEFPATHTHKHLFIQINRIFNYAWFVPMDAYINVMHTEISLVEFSQTKELARGTNADTEVPEGVGQSKPYSLKTSPH